MALDEKIQKRFKELVAQGDAVLRTSRPTQFLPIVDARMAEQWGVSTHSFIGRVIGKDSEHYLRFGSLAEQLAEASKMVKAFAVLEAAYADFKGGYLFDTRNSIRAEVFDDFIEQAEYFLNEGYFQVAAVIAGAVLEDSMRQIFTRRGLTLPLKPKLDTMNTELVKTGVYNVLTQKKVTWLADIRNKAAHGKWKELTQDDAVEMVKAVRRFAEDYS